MIRSNALLTLLALSFSCVALSQTTYYVKNGGNDNLDGRSDGNAWATVSKVNGHSFSPGNSILFKCGDTWREWLVVSSSGSASSPITFGAYGSGAKPKLLGSVDLSSTGAWTLDGGNVWKTTATIGAGASHSPDVGSLIFNSEALVGVKKDLKASMGSQGDFWYNTSNNILYLYSAGNPGSYYSHIEAARTPPTWNDGLVTISGKSYVTVENLDLRYGGTLGVDMKSNPQHILVQNCDLSWIGGCYTFGTERYGNGIQLFEAGSDITVQHCRIDEIYDEALSAQGYNGPYTVHRLNWHYNLLSRSNNSFSFWVRDGSSSADSIFFENNTCSYAGQGWSQAQRPDNYVAGHLTLHECPGTVTHLFIRNNIFNDVIGGARGCVYFDGSWSSWLSGLTLDYNCYRYTSGGSMIIFDGVGAYTYTQFATWRTASGKDANSKNTDPLVISPSNFHLQAGSPCIDAGLSLGYTQDFDGNAISTPDMGACEYATDNSKTGIDQSNGSHPTELMLNQNFPNPFNPTTIIRFGLPFAARVSLRVFNTIGQEVATLVDEQKSAGSYDVTFNANGLASGAYFYRIQAGSFVQTKKLLLLR